MAYQGETIKFVIKGDENINLDKLKNFAVVVYLHCNCENENSNSTKILYKNNTDQIKAVLDNDLQPTNTYIGILSSSDTARMIDGQYNIELLTLTDSEERSIYQQKHAFTLECSVSKNIDFPQ